jgi:hypothetical protein
MDMASAARPRTATVRHPRAADRSQPTRGDRQAGAQRDEALRRSGSITKSIAALSVAALAAFGVYVSRAFPGHAASTTVPTSGAAPVGSTAAGGTGGGQSGSSISPPANAPAPTQQQAPVVSGSS